MQNQFVHSNFQAAAGRLGLAVTLVPILLGVAALFLLDEHGSAVTAAIMTLMTVPFLWYALNVPLSVRIHNVLSVRYLLSTRDYFKDDITAVRNTSMPRPFGLWRLMPLAHLGRTNIPAITIDTREGRSIQVIGSPQQADEMRRAVQALPQ